MGLLIHQVVHIHRVAQALAAVGLHPDLQALEVQVAVVQPKNANSSAEALCEY